MFHYVGLTKLDYMAIKATLKSRGRAAVPSLFKCKPAVTPSQIKQLMEAVKTGNTTNQKGSSNV